MGVLYGDDRAIREALEVLAVQILPGAYDCYRDGG